jgi:hypothetical protein
MFADGYTTFHTLLSFAAILTGVIAVAGLFGAGASELITALFLLTAVATSATGFGFPFNGVLPSHVVGAIALIVLAAVIFARYFAHLAGAWRWIYAIGLVVSLYVLVFVLIAQLFIKISVLRDAAPTQSEPPFAITQLIVLVIFALIAFAAARRFRPGGFVMPSR